MIIKTCHAPPTPPFGPSDPATRALLDRTLGALGLGLHPAPAVHCPDAWSVRLSLPGASLVYSGDTIPTAALRALCRPPPTILVHEATFAPGLLDEARRKRHCTVAQALELACLARPALTLLTHFSQRYPRYPEGVLGQGSDAPPVAVAFDGMIVPFGALRLLPAVQPLAALLLEKRAEEEADDVAV